jgi:hypothetical protein
MIDSFALLFSNKLEREKKSIHSFCYTSHGHGCGIYSALIFVKSKALEWAHSKLRNHFSNAVYWQKSTDRKPQL